MRKRGFTVLAVLVGLAFASCVTLNDREMTANEKAQVQVLGQVMAEFNSYQFFHIIGAKGIKQKAYIELMREARRQYEGTVEIRNIAITGGWSWWELFNILGYGVGGYFVVLGVEMYLPFAIGASIAGVVGNTQKITATGDVVMLTGQSGSAGVTQKMTEAVTNLSQEIAGKLPQNASVAVLSVFSTNRNTSEYIIGELEYYLVNSGRLRIVDRRRLDQIRTEQNFQMSGDVSDDSAISIGNMLGANIVITGEISGVGTNQRIILKALDVRTAQIITMVREQL